MERCGTGPGVRCQGQLVLSRRLFDPGVKSHRDSVATATVPDEFSTTTAGFQWGSKGDGVWATEGIVSHNNRRGIYRWNNHNLVELSDETTLYNNHASFIQGAYGANHLYDGLTLHSDSIIWKTGAGESEEGGYPTAGIVDFDIDVMGRAEECVHLSGAQVPGGDFDISASKPDKGLDLVIRVQHEDGSAYEMTWRGTDPDARIQEIRAFDSQP